LWSALTVHWVISSPTYCPTTNHPADYSDVRHGTYDSPQDVDAAFLAVGIKLPKQFLDAVQHDIEVRAGDTVRPFDKHGLLLDVSSF
jgi:hypothetical protein